jgi:hypothetical protein
MAGPSPAMIKRDWSVSEAAGGRLSFADYCGSALATGTPPMPSFL